MSESTAGPNQEALKQAWARAVEKAKQEIIAPMLWRALERTAAVTWENNTFVVGLASADGQLASQLHSADYLSALERILRSAIGNSNARLRVIEGTTLKDWEMTKAQDAAAATQRKQSAEKFYKEIAAFGSWDEVYEQVTRLWATMEYRNLASGRARYIQQSFEIVGKALDTLYPVGAPVDELNERGLSRVCERISSMVGSDSVMIALALLERRRKSEA